MFLWKKWLYKCSEEFKTVYYRRYGYDVFVLFRSHDHLIKFRDYLNKWHPNMKFSFEEDKNGKWSFLDAEVSQVGNKFVTTVYRKPTFNGVYVHFDSFLLLHINLAWFMVWLSDVFDFTPTGITFIMSYHYWKTFFKKNGYPISFIDFNTFLDQSYVKWPEALTAKKKTLALVLSFLRELSLQIKTKLRQILKRTLSCCKI